LAKDFILTVFLVGVQNGTSIIFYQFLMAFFTAEAADEGCALKKAFANRLLVCFLWPKWTVAWF